MENSQDRKPEVNGEHQGTSNQSSAKNEAQLKLARHKCLKSPLLSNSDIANEILERSQKKNPPKLPEGGDVLFTMKLTKRLAKRVVKQESLESLSPAKIKREKSPTMEARELLAVLQDGPESHYLEKPKPKTPRVNKNVFKMNCALDPDVEKALALKQLMEFTKSPRAKKESNNNVKKNNNISNNNNNNEQPSSSNGKPKQKLIQRKSAQSRELEMLLQDEGAINMLYAIKKGDSDTKDNLLPSKRRMKKALIKKAQEVKEALLGGATESGLSLRHRVSNTPLESDKLRKNSVDSVDSEHSENESFTFASPAEASKIIRRHSSSSSYSSRSNSPRRMSMERDRSPVFIPKIQQSDPSRSNGTDKNPMSPTSSTEGTSKRVQFSRNGLQRLQTEIASKLKAGLKSPPEPKTSKTFIKPAVPKSVHVWKMLQEDWSNPDDPDPVASPRQDNGAPSPSVTHEGKTFERKLPNGQRVYKELMVRQIDHLLHVVIDPVSTELPQSFNSQVLRELSCLFEEVSRNNLLRVVFLTSNGSAFSNGIDFPSLINPNLELRKMVANELATAIRTFSCKLCMMKKPVIAGVDGPAIGLGTVMLAYCDFVFATENACFSTPYAKLGHVPEAAATVALSHALGSRMANNLLIGSRTLNAQEALECGLVSRLLPKDKFIEEVIPLCSSIAEQSSQSMESSKALLLHNMRSRIESVLSVESSLLQQHWLSDDCQARLKSNQLFKT